MVSFQTIVIFDLETTGLPKYEHNLTKITELSLVACLISHCQDGKIPRVVNKLTLALNPGRKITPEASQISGLHNELLEQMEQFNNGVVLMMNYFIKRLPQPVCLVSHNGNKFDFPIIRKFMAKYNCEFINDIYCADSLLAFQVLLPELKSTQQSMSITSESTNLQNQGKEKNKVETTPKTKTVGCNMSPRKINISSTLTHLSACRKLNFENPSEDIEELQSQTNKLKRKASSNTEENHESTRHHRKGKAFTLSNIYYFLHSGGSYTVHKAEDDCIALLSCIIKCKDKFFNWMSENACLLNTIDPLY